MEWAIDYIMEHYAQGRCPVVLGQGLNLLRWIPFIRETTADLRILETLDTDIDPSSEYLIICEDIYVDYEKELSQMGMKEIQDYYHWTKYARTNGHLPIDVTYKGAKIGYGSYFPYSKKIMKHIGGIGRFCSIADSVIIQWNHSMNRITTSSLYPMLSMEAGKTVAETPTDKDPDLTGGKVLIGNDVWIGANVFINASRCSKIGDGAIIGTASLVMEDVPPYAIVYGSPAKVQRYRFPPEQIEVLLKVKWWEWSRQTLSENISLLMNPAQFFDTYQEE